MNQSLLSSPLDGGLISRAPLLSSPLWSSTLKGPLLSLSVEPPLLSLSLSVEPLSLLGVDPVGSEKSAGSGSSRFSASLPAHHGSGSSRFREKRGEWIQSVVPHPIRSRERECIYYICYYAMNDRSISSPQFKRLVDEPRTRQGARLIRTFRYSTPRERRGEGVVPRPNLENLSLYGRACLRILRQTKTAKLVGT
jgi:hypothetical protein